MVATSKAPNDELFQSLQADLEALEKANIKNVYRIGDCDAPGLIAHAVFAGHRLAREIGQPEKDLSYLRGPVW